MIQVDIFPIEMPKMDKRIDDCEYEGESAKLLGRIIELRDGRKILVERYRDESQLGEIMDLIGRELSEPYSIYTYRYFINYWPEMCILAHDPDNQGKIVGVVICKLEHQRVEEEDIRFGQGYIAMLAVENCYRGMGLGTRLVRTVIRVMEERECDEVVLETEVSNARSLSLYGRLGFIRESRLFRYYLNGSDAFRLKLYLKIVATINKNYEQIIHNNNCVCVDEKEHQHAFGSRNDAINNNNNFPSSSNSTHL